MRLAQIPMAQETIKEAIWETVFRLAGQILNEYMPELSHGLFRLNLLRADHIVCLDVWPAEHAKFRRLRSVWQPFTGNLAALSAHPELATLTLGYLVHKDLEPIGSLASLRILRLPMYTMSLAPLARLTGLEQLYLTNFIQDDVGCLAGLVELRVLQLGTQRGSLAPLSGMTKLLKLELYNFAGSIAFMANMRNLRVLELPMLSPDQVPGEDAKFIMSTITQLTRLQSLNLAQYDGDPQEIARLTGLTSLVLGIRDCSLRFLTKLPRLKWLALNRFDGDIVSLMELTELESLSLHDYVESLVPLSKLRQLKFLYLRMFTGDLTPLAGLTNLERLDLDLHDGNMMPLAGLTKLQWINLAGNDEGDLTPLKNVVHAIWPEMIRHRALTQLRVQREYN